MKKTSSINSSRIHNMYVHRNTVVSTASKVSSVDKVNPVENSTFFSSGNFLYYSDAFYENIEEFQKNYKKFYNNQVKLNQLSKFLSKKENYKFDYIDDIVRIISTLCKKFNNAMNSLRDMEKDLSINLHEPIIELVFSQQHYLSRIGVLMTNDYNINFNIDVLKNNYFYNKNLVLFFLNNKIDFIRNLSNHFKEIHVSMNEFYNSINKEKLNKSIIDKKG